MSLGYQTPFLDQVGPFSTPLKPSKGEYSFSFFPLGHRLHHLDILLLCYVTFRYIPPLLSLLLWLLLWFLFPWLLLPWLLLWHLLLWLFLWLLLLWLYLLWLFLWLLWLICFDASSSGFSSGSLLLASPPALLYWHILWLSSTGFYASPLLCQLPPHSPSLAPPLPSPPCSISLLFSSLFQAALPFLGIVPFGADLYSQILSTSFSSCSSSSG
jgi:hypothetical protein